MNSITSAIYALINKSDACIEKAAAVMTAYELTGEPTFLDVAEYYAELSTDCNKIVQIMIETLQKEQQLAI